MVGGGGAVVLNIGRERWLSGDSTRKGMKQATSSARQSERKTNCAPGR